MFKPIKENQQGNNEFIDFEAKNVICSIEKITVTDTNKGYNCFQIIFKILKSENKKAENKLISARLYDSEKGEIYIFNFLKAIDMIEEDENGLLQTQVIKSPEHDLTGHILLADVRNTNKEKKYFEAHNFRKAEK